MKLRLLMIIWVALCLYPWHGYSRGATGTGTTSGMDMSSSFHFQSTYVTGKVTDETGVSMPGVNIVVKGTTTGTTTDADGLYSLNTANISNAVLVFSFIGYATQEQVVNNQSVINVSLIADVQALGEVVVVGYGTQRKSDITGAIASVSEQALREVPVTSLSQALQGRAAGIDIQKDGGDSKPGANPVIRVRGVRSLSAGNSPLFIVDGIPFNGNISDLNPDDVVSIEILKDASSTAIYGSRGANGVILVTTKRGKAGDAPTITYSGYVGYTKPLRKFDLMNGEEFAEFRKWSRINGAPGTYTGLDDPDLLDSFESQELESIQLGRSTDWQDLVYKTGIRTNHQVGISGGTDKTQYAVSVGYFKETGIYPVQAFQRATVKLSVDQQLGSRFKIGLSSLNNFSVREGEGMNPMGQVLRASPLAAPLNDDGELWGVTEPAFLPGSNNQVWNPLADFVNDAVVENRKRNGTFTTAYLEAKLIDGLKFRLNAGAEIRSDIYGNFYGGNTTKNLGKPNTTSNRSGASFNYTLENLLIYDKVFAEKHKINFTGLYSLQESLSQSNEFNNTGNPVDYMEYYNPELGENFTGSGSYQKWDIVSYMGRLNYVFNEKYLLTLTMRSDGSSRLAEGNKFKTFPSAAIGWNIIEEPFMATINTLTNLKVRASYGMVGNTAIDPYTVLGRLSPLRYNFGDVTVTGVYPSHAPNHTLEWEYTTSGNIGVDFGILQNRITGSVELYKQMTDKLLLDMTLPPTSGIANEVKTNVGKTENKGVEIQLNTVIAEGDGRDKFRWTTDINVYLNRGKIVSLSAGDQDDLGNNWFIGEPIGTVYDYKNIGIWQNTSADSALAKSYGLTVAGSTSVIGTIKVANLSVDYDADGNPLPVQKINPDDRTFIGNSQPKLQGGITSRFAYKGFDFTVVGVGRYGGTLISRMHNSGFANTYQGNYNNLRTDYWTPDNHQNEYPKPSNAFTNPLYNSTLGYFDGTYLKIRSLSLGYTLPPALLQRAGIRSLRVYATVNDAFILFSPFVNKYNGMDTEGVNAGSNRQQLDVDTPAVYSVVFGLNASF